MLRGKALKKGDTIGVINISSISNRKLDIDSMVIKLDDLGLKAIIGKTCEAEYGYLAGDDDLRVKELNDMFMNKDVNAIVCIKGGYGAIRILDKIDYEVIKNNPKIFIGYSDVTAALIALNQKANLVTFHGPMLIGEFERGMTGDSFHYVKTVLTGKENKIEYKNDEVKCVVSGEVEAPIIGGNLSVIASTIGTEFEIDTKDKILMIEDIGEKVYRIDSMLAQLKLSGKLEDCAGFIIGKFTDCIRENSRGFYIYDLINQYIKPFNKPTITNFQVGHVSPNYMIPFGVEAYLNAREKRLIINKAVD